MKQFDIETFVDEQTEILDDFYTSEDYELLAEYSLFDDDEENIND